MVCKCRSFEKKVAKITDEVKAKDLELQTTPGLVSQIAIFQERNAKLREISKKDEANVDVLGGLHEDILAVEKAVAELLPAAAMVCDVRLKAAMKLRS